MKPKVFFTKCQADPVKVAKVARKLLEKVITANKIKLGREVPLKVHPGNPGNVTFIKPENFSSIIKYLKDKKIKTYFIETNQAPGAERSAADEHVKIAKQHGFTELPFVIAGGQKGLDDVSVSIKGGKHFKECKIAAKLYRQKQVIVLSHFKGHVASGFGGAIKMLALGFASGRGKTEIHCKKQLREGQAIPWKFFWTLYHGPVFRERTAEYALAAAQNKQIIYINFALNLVKNCDCDGREMTPIYEDLGVLASTDPVAIDKACFDLLAKREGKEPYSGDDIFAYAQQIGLGSQTYQLVEITELDNS